MCGSRSGSRATSRRSSRSSKPIRSSISPRARTCCDGYRALKTRIDAALPQLFSVFPKADYEVREVEAFRAQSAAGAYYQQPSADGSRPGIFYVNTYNLKAQPKFGMETLSLHEASPGASLPGVDPAGTRGRAAIPPLRRRLHGLRRGLGALRRVARQGTRPVHRPVPVVRPAERRAAARDAPRRRHRPAREGLDPRTGDQVHARQLDDGRVGRRVRGRALHRLARPGARLQGRATCGSRACAARRSRRSGRSSTCATSTARC